MGIINETVFAYLAFGVRTFAGAVLILAGAAKIVEPREQRTAAVDSYRVLPFRAARFAATALPGVELALGLSLVVGFLMPLPVVGVAALLTAFAAGMAVNLRRGRKVPCACFGVTGESTISWTKVVANLALAGAVAAAGVGGGGWDTPLALFPRAVALDSLDAAGVVLSALAVLALLALGQMALALVAARWPKTGGVHG